MHEDNNKYPNQITSFMHMRQTQISLIMSQISVLGEYVWYKLVQKYMLNENVDDISRKCFLFPALDLLTDLKSS